MRLRLDHRADPWEGDGALWLFNPEDEAAAGDWVARAGAPRSTEEPPWGGAGSFSYDIRDALTEQMADGWLLAWGQEFPVSVAVHAPGRPPAIIGQMQLGVSMLGDPVGEQVVALFGRGRPPSQLIEGGVSVPTSMPPDTPDESGSDTASDAPADSPAEVVSRTTSVAIRLASIAVVERIAMEMLRAEREDPWVRAVATSILSDMALLRQFVEPGAAKGPLHAALERLTEMYKAMNPLIQKGVDYGLISALEGLLRAFGIDVP